MKFLLYLWLMLTGELSSDAIVSEGHVVRADGPILELRQVKPDHSGTELSGDGYEVLNRRLIILEDTHFRRY
jgi:hypothetical protein